MSDMKRRELFGSFSAPSNGHFLYQKCLGSPRPDTLDSSFVRASFDHLVGAQQQCRGKVDTERFRGREIDGEIELDRILNRKVAGFHTTQNLVHVDRCAPKLVDVARRIRHETAGAYVLPVWIHPR